MTTIKILLKIITTREKLVPEILQKYITEEEWRGDIIDLACNDISDEDAKALAKWKGRTLT